MALRLAKTTRAKELWRGAASGVASAAGASASKAAPATKVVGFNRAWVDVVVALSFFPVDWLSRLAVNDFLSNPQLMPALYLEWASAIQVTAI